MRKHCRSQWGQWHHKKIYWVKSTNLGWQGPTKTELTASSVSIPPIWEWTLSSDQKESQVGILGNVNQEEFSFNFLFYQCNIPHKTSLFVLDFLNVSIYGYVCGSIQVSTVSERDQKRTPWSQHSTQCEPWNTALSPEKQSANSALNPSPALLPTRSTHGMLCFQCHPFKVHTHRQIFDPLK